MNAAAGLAQSLAGQPITATIEATASDDGGSRWSPVVPVASCSSCLLPGSAVGPDGTLVVSFEGLGTGSPELARSSDGGAVWTVSRIGEAGDIDDHLTAVAFSCDGTALAALHQVPDPAGSSLFDVRLAVTSDHGSSWTDLLVVGPFDHAAFTDRSSDSPTGSSLRRSELSAGSPGSHPSRR